MQTYESISILEEAAMGKGRLVNHIPELLVEKNLDAKTFVAYCMLQGMAQSTAYSLVNGETNMRSKTLQIAASVLGVGIGQILENEQ
jgi:hypothetical protein